jgi:hypothetical protein
MTFDVSMPVDRTGDAVFSVESGNLVEFSYSKKAPKATNMIVGGGGELTDRKFLLGFNAVENDRWGRRIEVFRDRRDTVDTQEMLQTLQEELSSQAEENAVSLRPIDVPGREYGTDYEVNDLVTVEGIEARIAEVRIPGLQVGKTQAKLDGVPTWGASNVMEWYEALTPVAPTATTSCMPTPQGCSPS